jgi:hypothetical protein
MAGQGHQGETESRQREGQQPRAPPRHRDRGNGQGSDRPGVGKHRRAQQATEVAQHEGHGERQHVDPVVPEAAAGLLECRPACPAD